LRSHVLPQRQPIEPERILYHLSRSQLLEKYLRGAIIEESLKQWVKSPEFELVCRKIEPAFLKKNHRSIVFQTYKQKEFGRFIRSRFLVEKTQFDRILFSVIQVKSLDLAQELYFRIKEQKQPLHRISIAHSEAATAKQGGTIGPISVLQLHPLIRHYLTGIQPGQLSPIFQLDEHYMFVRLDRSLPIQLTPQTEQKLLDEIFEEWLQKQIVDRIGKIKLIASPPTIELVRQGNSSVKALPSSNSSNFDEEEPTGTFAPTSSFFFPKVSPDGEILSPMRADDRSLNSSFLIPKETLTQGTFKSYGQVTLGQKIIAFLVFFCLFLSGGLSIINFFGNPVNNTKKIDNFLPPNNPTLKFADR
jgi:PPIC-type PPIASE domain